MMEPSRKSLEPATQLVLMALDEAHAQRPVFALAPEPGLPRRFPSARFLYHDYAAYLHDRRYAAAVGQPADRLHFAARWLDAPTDHDLAVVYMPKSKARAEYAFVAVSKLLQPDAKVFVVGAKKSGVRSCMPLVERCFGPVVETRAARHCVLVDARKRVEHLEFEGETAYDIDALGQRVHVVGMPGVFSAHALDPGTELLLGQLGGAAFDRALDWGCGSGVIGAALKLARPQAEVDFVDADAMALAATRRTLAANGLAADRVWASDVFSDVEGRYDLIACNPPFHAGQATDFSITERLIAEAPDHLTPRGRLVFVANAFLKYPAHAWDGFRRVRVAAETKQYRVFEARRGKR